MTDEQGLKPCPFCGSPAETQGGGRIVKCSYDGCICLPMTCTKISKSSAEAKRLWNTRSQELEGLDEEKIERIVRCGIFYKEECAGVTGVKITLTGFENVAKAICSKFGTRKVENCKCVYESDCHGIEMIKAPSGKEYAIGGTNNKDRFLFCPWCGGAIIKELEQS